MDLTSNYRVWWEREAIAYKSVSGIYHLRCGWVEGQRTNKEAIRFRDFIIELETQFQSSSSNSKQANDQSIWWCISDPNHSVIQFFGLPRVCMSVSVDRGFGWERGLPLETPVYERELLPLLLHDNHKSFARFRRTQDFESSSTVAAWDFIWCGDWRETLILSSTTPFTQMDRQKLTAPQPL